MNNTFLYTCGNWSYKNEFALAFKLASTCAVLLCINFVVWGLSKFFQKRLSSQKTIWLRAFFQVLSLPSSIFIWVAGLSYSLLVDTNSPLSQFGDHLIELSFIITLVWVVLRMINYIETIYSMPEYAKSKQQQEIVISISRIVKIIVIFLGLIAILQALDVSVSGLVAFGGISAAGVTFAARDILGNFFGGLMIFLNRPFSVGDWIRSAEKDIEGTVEKIGWLLTRIRTLDKRPLYVPNGIFSQIAIENPQRMSHRRIKQIIGLRYNDANKIADITKAIKTMLQEHVEIDQNQIIIVDLVNFGASSLDILVYTFTKTTDWLRFQDIQQDIFLKIIAIIEQHDAQCAFPTTTIDFSQKGRYEFTKLE